MSINATDIKFLKGVGEKRALLLNKLGIDTVGALLRFYPRSYEDWSDTKPIYDAPMDIPVCIKGKITSEISERYIRQNMTIYKFSVEDKSGEMCVTIFNNKYLAAKLHTGSEYLFYGKLTGAFFAREMSSPEIAPIESGGIRPIYRATQGINSKGIEKIVRNAIVANIGEDSLPQSVKEKYGLCDLRFALENIHFPRNREALEKARKRLVFEELFVLQMGLSLMKHKKKKAAPFSIVNNYKDEYLELLPYSLTSAQNKVIDECIEEIMSGRLMNRLVQGDVGSGKTAIAAALCYIVARNGYQAALMAPTEILAQQHYNTLSALLEKKGISCCRLIGSMPKKEKNEAYFSISSGEASVVIGTHALLSESVEFKNLALVVTDEQHRFGVEQRSKLTGKGISPHTLVMSATPIPRTLGLVIYGDLDISVVDEYPKGRQQVESYCVTGELRNRVYKYIKKHLDEGRQGYIVCPIVEENDTIDIKPAQEYYESLKKCDFRDYEVGLLHGKMKSRQKDEVMRRFADGEIKLLVCTTVVEVGIDVPNAAIMVIENAERFGLSQLHQLRGRVGRGGYKSTCIFISDIQDGITKQRLDIIKNNTDGFKIADEDLRLRGPGDFLGNRQHGLPRLNIADISADLETLRISGEAARSLIAEDSRLEKVEHQALKKEIVEFYKKLQNAN